MAKEKRPSWFKVFLHQKPLIMELSDEAAGAALKAALTYLDDGEIPNDLNPTANMLFNAAFKPYVEESIEDYNKAIENGRKGGQAKARSRSQKKDYGDGNGLDILSIE